MNRREFLSGAVVLATAAAVTTEVITTKANIDVSPALVGIHWPSGSEWSAFKYINAYRAERGLKRLEMSRTLAAAARHHAYYMSRTDNVSHELGSVSWTQNILNYGYPSGAGMGEIVAAGRSGAEATVQQWKDSPAHNSVMLSPHYIRIGVGRVYYASGKYDYYWCCTFGTVSHRTIYQ